MDGQSNYNPRAFRRRRASLDDLRSLLERADTCFEHRKKSNLKPHERKQLRLFNLTEVCDYLDIHPPAFYEFTRDKPDLQGTVVGSQRLFSLEQIHKLQEARGTLPRQRLNITRALTISVGNFKGGVAKTFTATHLAQYLTLRGYRTLLIDLDPQASLSGIFQVSDGNVSDWQTVLPYYYGKAMVEDMAQGDPELAWPKSLRESIQKTYWSGLDIIGANLNLYSGEFVLGMRRDREENFRFHRPLHDAIEDVRGDYDIIIIDNAPALSLSCAGAIFAADALMIPLQAEMPDYESARAFKKLGLEILGAIEQTFHDVKEFELFRFLVTRYKRSGQDSITADIFEAFGDYCVPEPVIDSTAVSQAGAKHLTLYEAKPSADINRETYKRMLKCLKDVNSVLEFDIEEVFRERAGLPSLAEQPKDSSEGGQKTRPTERAA
jgi:chromosome partitioning protein